METGRSQSKTTRRVAMTTMRIRRAIRSTTPQKKHPTRLLFLKKRTDWGMDHGGLPVGPDGWTKTKTKTKKKKEEAPPGSFSVRVENRETAFGDLPTGTPQADMLLLIDRDVDMVTPLCTQTTYEGLIDEVLGFSGGGWFRSSN